MHFLFKISSIFLVLIGQNANAQSTEYKLGQIVVERKPMMFEMQTAYLTLLSIRNGESSDYVAAAMAASLIEETVPNFVALMEPGTARGEAPGSRAKPEVWSQGEAFSEAAEWLQAKAAALADASASEDPVVYSKAFEEMSEACTACHGLRPSSGGLFRFAKDE
ncbi:cytochrome c [Ruegeria sp. SCP11]|uniref:cytochrome c n=1 Tax=Ruegeria sp. SCP11 TaxID=3141378 RepID=UPI00333B13E1